MRNLLESRGRNRLGKSLLLSLLLLFTFGQIVVPVVYASTTPQEHYDALYQWPLWNPDITSQMACGSSGVGIGGTGGGVGSSASQTAIIKIIIGIAKTDNLGEAGAIIGLMVGEDESTFTVYANSNVPISLSIPHTAVGSGANSVGVFQQQPNYNWSTYATGAAALTNRQAVAQDMDPASSAEIFFGSPPGAKINAPNPSALTHGLMDISGWRTMQPWVAAQAVQGSATANGSNYERFVSLAQNLVAQYYASTPALPLPIPFTGGVGSGVGGSTSGGGCAALASATVNCNAPVSGTSGLSVTRQNVVCIALAELAAWHSGKMRVGFRANSPDSFSKYSQNNDELWCADFVSWVFNSANYPVQPRPNWRNAAVVGLEAIGRAGGNFHWHPGGYTPSPGDIVIHEQGGESHTNIVVARSGNQLTLVGGDQSAGPGGYPNDSDVSEYQVSGYYGVDNITGYVSPN